MIPLLRKPGEAFAGTPIYAVAAGKVQEWSLPGLNSMLMLKHCLGGTWDENNQCMDGEQWYTTYMHIVPDQGIRQENADIAQGTQFGTGRIEFGDGLSASV